MENKSDKRLIVGFIVAIVCVSVVVVVFLSGYVVLPEFSKGGNNSQADPSATVSMPTPTLFPKPSPIELTIETTVGGSITNTTTLNRYTFVVPQAGPIYISIARDNGFNLDYVSMLFFDSAGVQIGGNNNQTLGTRFVPIGRVFLLDLEAGTYFIEIAPVDDYMGNYWLALEWYD